MKRIAAMAALVITMLAVPAAGAMASTGGTGAGYGRPGPVRVACPVGHHRVRVRIDRLRHRHGRPVLVRITCPHIPLIPVRPVPKACRLGLLRFDMAAGSSTVTEVSGPVLAPVQEFVYRGDTYTVMTINPGADSFTVFRDGFLFVNKGAAITGGVGVMACAR
jgi:hypothetical protein